jgi:hypothetical protein
MAKFRLSANAEVDLLTREEVKGVLNDWDAEQAARGRAVKALRFTGVLGAVGVGVPPGPAVPQSPASGYIWSLRNFAVLGTASGTWRAYTVTDTSGNYQPSGQGITGFIPAAIGAMFQWGAGQAWLYNGEYLSIGNSVAQTQVGYTLQVLEAPAEMAWKLAI